MASDNLETVTFGAGCFWGVEELFRQIKGVKETAVGYTGGNVKNPTYEDVCSGSTGHVEAIEIKFNPKETSYGKMLEVFWMSHNPTQADGQGNDVGTNYRAAIFYHTAKQKKLAEQTREDLAKSAKYKSPITTEIRAAGTFWPAEEYHQRYLEKRHGIGYCHINIKEILGKVKG